MYSVALIEDNRITRTHLKDLFEKNYSDMEVQVEAYRVRDAIQRLTEMPCDVVIMDIELTDGNAFDLLQELKDQQALNFHLILLSKSKHVEYMIRGMNFKARHYLYKPISEVAFREAIDLVREEIEAEQNKQGTPASPTNKEDRLLLRLSDKTSILLSKSSIYYVQNDGNRSLFFADNGIWETNKHIGFYDEILAKSPYPFFRIHQSYSINLNKLKKFIPAQECVILENEETLPVARRKLKALKETLSSEGPNI